MEELKTQRTAASVDAVIQSIADDARRDDCLTQVREWSRGRLVPGRIRFPQGERHCLPGAGARARGGAPLQTRQVQGRQALYLHQTSHGC